MRGRISNRIKEHIKHKSVDLFVIILAPLNHMKLAHTAKPAAVITVPVR